jgi:flavodoxin
MSKVLVVHYSRTGTTRKLADAIVAATGWDVEPIVDTCDRGGFWGFLRSGFQAVTQRRTRLQPSRRDLRSYDLVLIGSPVWDRSVSTPVRTYLGDHAAELPNVAFFLTFGGDGKEQAFSQMSALSGKAPLATLALTQEQMLHDTPVEAVARFVEGLVLQLGGRTSELPTPAIKTVTTT